MFVSKYDVPSLEMSSSSVGEKKEKKEKMENDDYE